MISSRPAQQRPASTPGAAFDTAALSYDEAFTDTRLGRILRARVWTRLDRSFGAGDRVLELGCGTGADAIHLAGRGVAVLATDASAGMLDVARKRIDARGSADLVSLDRLDLRDASALDRLPGLGPFDGAFSDFGAMNAVADRPRSAAALAQAVRPRGRLVLVVMAPFCPWEVAWHLLHGEPSVALRRWRKGGVARVGTGARMRVWYPSPATLRRDFAPWFRMVDLIGLGVALPPSGLSAVVERRPRLLGLLDAVERRVARGASSAWIADHYLAIFERD